MTVSIYATVFITSTHTNVLTLQISQLALTLTQASHFRRSHLLRSHLLRYFNIVFSRDSPLDNSDPKDIRYGTCSTKSKKEPRLRLLLRLINCLSCCMTSPHPSTWAGTPDGSQFKF